MKQCFSAGAFQALVLYIVLQGILCPTFPVLDVKCSSFVSLLKYKRLKPRKEKKHCEGVSQDDSATDTAGIPPCEGSHVCVVGEGACILFPEPVLSHFNPPALPPLPWAEEKERPPSLPTPTWGAMLLRLSCRFTENRL